MNEKKIELRPNQKVFILDTCVLLHDPHAVEKFGDNIIVISIHTLEELDHKKKLDNNLGFAAREASRVIEGYRKSGNLEQGVETANGGKIFVAHRAISFSSLPVLMERSVDNRIILLAYTWRKQVNGNGKNVILVSKDTNMRLKASACGISTEEYKGDKFISSIEEMYSGVKKFTIPSGENNCVEELFREGKLPVEKLPFLDFSNLYPNQCLTLTLEKTLDLLGELKLVHAIYKKEENLIYFVKDKLESLPIKPENEEQLFAYNLMMDKSLNLITLIGKAGTGKTLMALLAGYLKFSDSLVDEIMVVRPNIEIGQPIGFLPGSIDQKFAPWAQPIFDNMNLIMKNVNSMKNKDDTFVYNRKKKRKKNKTNNFIEGVNLTINPINFLRGRSLNGKFIIVDEAQNLTPLQAKLIITRAGFDTTIVLVGDVYQIDNPYLDSVSNGLSYVVEKFKSYEMSGHVVLTKSERSSLSELAANIM